MRSLIFALACLSLFALVGCDGHAFMATDTRDAQVSAAASTAAAEAAEQALERKRKEVVAELETKLAALDRSIGKLQMRLKSSAAAQAQARTEIDELDAKRKLAEKSLTELQLSGVSALQEVMRGATTACNELQQAYAAAELKIRAENTN